MAAIVSPSAERGKGLATISGEAERVQADCVGETFGWRVSCFPASANDFDRIRWWFRAFSFRVSADVARPTDATMSRQVTHGRTVTRVSIFALNFVVALDI